MPVTTEKPAFAFTVIGEPVPQLRPRVVRNKYNGGVHAFTPDKAVAHAERIRLAAVEEIRRTPGSLFHILDGPLRLVAVFYRSRPKSAKRGSSPIQKPDLSNLCKICEDALNGLVWKDDSQIVSAYIAKRYVEEGEQPRTEVAIYELTEKTASERPSADQLSIFGLDAPIVA